MLVNPKAGSPRVERCSLFHLLYTIGSYLKWIFVWRISMDCIHWSLLQKYTNLKPNETKKKASGYSTLLEICDIKLSPTSRPRKLSGAITITMQTFFNALSHFDVAMMKKQSCAISPTFFICIFFVVVALSILVQSASRALGFYKALLVLSAERNFILIRGVLRHLHFLP